MSEERTSSSIGQKLTTRVAVLEERCRGLETRCKDLDQKVEDMHRSIEKKFEAIEKKFDGLGNWIRGVMGGLIVALIMLAINLLLKRM